MTKTKTFFCNALYENSYAVSSGGACVIIDPGFDGEGELARLYSYLGKEGLTPQAVLLTHGHADHIVSAGVLQRRYGIPVYLGEGEDGVLAANDSLAAAFGVQLPKGMIPFGYTTVHDGDIIGFTADGAASPDAIAAPGCRGRGPSPMGGASERPARGEAAPSAALSFRVIATPGHTPGGVCWYNEADGLLFSGDTLFEGTIGRTDLPLGEYDDLIRSVMEKLIILPGETVVYPGHGPSTEISVERTSNPFLEPFNEPETSFDPQHHTQSPSDER